MKSSLTALRDQARKVAGPARNIVSFLASTPLLYPLARLKRGENEPWVIGGHGGRLRVDNCAVLHEYMVNHTRQPVIWISTNDSVLAELSARGLPCLCGNTARARWTIFKAPVLIYSHGEDDLELCLLFMRGLTGFRVHLNHSMNLLKAGQYHDPGVHELRGVRRWAFEQTVPHFDALLASSDKERANFALSYPDQAHKVHLGGGAHLDGLLEARRDLPATERTLLYFPTWREERQSQQALGATVEALMDHPRLQAWLADQDYRLLVGAHINTVGLSQAERLQARVQWLPPAELQAAMLRCAGFISDYSGAIFDYLALDKPMIFFPYDLDHYLERRNFYDDYEDIAYGPVVWDVEELVELIVSGQWQDLQPYAAKRSGLRDLVFPTLEPRYAKTCYETIDRLWRESLRPGQGNPPGR